MGRVSNGGSGIIRKGSQFLNYVEFLFEHVHQALNDINQWFSKDPLYHVPLIIISFCKISKIFIIKFPRIL